MTAKQMARALAWVGIGLGLIEASAPRAFGRAVGLERHSALIRAYGFREIAAGAIVLAARESDRWLWLRVAGDGLDGALLARGLRPDNPLRGRTLAATLAVTPIVVLDALFARRPGHAS